MTVLLTGGAGYIGSHVAVELLQSGYDVIIADNFYNSSQEVPERIREITEKSVRTYNVDIQNSAALEQIFKQHEINAVMHFAGYKAVGEAVQQPLKYYRGNLDSTLTLLETMGKYQVKNLIFQLVCNGLWQSIHAADYRSVSHWQHRKPIWMDEVYDRADCYRLCCGDSGFFGGHLSLFQSGGRTSQRPYWRGPQRYAQ